MRDALDPQAGGAVLKRNRGISVIELMIAISVLALLIGLAAPSMSAFLRNSQVRSVTEALQVGAHIARGEAVRRQRQVVLFRTASASCANATNADASGGFWAVRTIPLVAGEAVETIHCGALGDVAAGVTITGPTALCFNGAGRLVANANPGIGGTACAAPAAINNLDVTATGSDRPLRVVVTLSGKVARCDPARGHSSTAPDGCPS